MPLGSQRFTSIRTKLVAAIAGVSIAAFVALASLVNLISNNYLIQETTTRLSTLLNATVNQIESTVENEGYDILLGELAMYLIKPNQNVENDVHLFYYRGPDLNFLSSSIVATVGNPRELKDATGHLFIEEIATRARQLPRGQFGTARFYLGSGVGGTVMTYLAAFTHDWDRDETFALASPRSRFPTAVKLGDRLAGLAALKPGDSGRIEIFREDGYQVLNTEPGLQGIYRMPKSQSQMRDLVNGSLQTEEITGGGLTPQTQPFQYLFDSIPDLGLYVAVGASNSEVLSPLRQFRWYIIGFSVAFVGLVYVAILFVTNRLILRPLFGISNTVEGFGRGNLDTRIDIVSSDEIGTLAQTFNDMAERMREHSDNLESLVQRRTRDLLNAEKMASLGNLVAVITHEINTPLGIVITGMSHLGDKARALSHSFQNNDLTASQLESFLKSFEELDSILGGSLERVDDQLKRIRKMAVDQQIEETRKFELAEYSQEIILSLGAQLRRKRVQAYVHGGPVSIVSEPGIFYRILSNLVMNSLVHGFETSGGRVDVTITQEDSQASFEYRDNGQGIDPEVLSRIFEPFVTTKRDAGGTGLGMAIIATLVKENLHGTISCESSPGEGVRFLIRFPINSDQSEANPE